MIKCLNRLDDVRVVKCLQDGNFVPQLLHKRIVRDATQMDRFHGENHVRRRLRRDGARTVDEIGVGFGADVLQPGLGLLSQTKGKESAEEGEIEARVNFVLRPDALLHGLAGGPANGRAALAHFGDAPHAAHAQHLGDFVKEQRIAVFLRPGQIAAELATGKFAAAGGAAGVAAGRVGAEFKGWGCGEGNVALGVFAGFGGDCG